MALGQLMIASVVSTIGEPFRHPWYKNKSHVLVLFLQLLWLQVQIFFPYNAFTSGLLSIKPLPPLFGLQLFALIGLNALVSSLLCWFADTLKPKDRTARYGKAIGSVS